VSLVEYELGFYIPEGDILRSRSREHLKSYTVASSVISKRNILLGFYVGTKKLSSVIF
jgi:hypothetical protein